jgi:hypothetical protein
MNYFIWILALLSVAIFFKVWLLPFLRKKIYLYGLYRKTLNDYKRIEDPKAKQLVKECANFFYERYKEVKL